MLGGGWSMMQQGPKLALLWWLRAPPPPLLACMATLGGWGAVPSEGVPRADPDLGFSPT